MNIDNYFSFPVDPKTFKVLIVEREFVQSQLDPDRLVADPQNKRIVDPSELSEITKEQLIEIAVKHRYDPGVVDWYIKTNPEVRFKE